jgi:membrane protein
MSVMKTWGRIFLETGKNWIADNVFKHAAAVSFYTLFSLSPVAIIAVSIAGAFYGEKAARGMLAEEIAGLVGEQAAVVIESAVEESRPERKGWLPTAIGIATLVVGATAVFAQLQESLNAIWCVAPKPSRSGFIVLLMRRLLSFALVLTVGFLLLVSLVITTAVTAAIHLTEHLIQVPPLVLRLTDIVSSLAIITVLFAMIFKVLPDVTLQWRDVWKGALLTALLFSGGRFLIAFYLGQSPLTSTYGAAGSLVAVLLWVYYSCLILFFGAEFTRTYLESSGRPPNPKETAVRVRREIVQENQYE